MCSVPAQDRGAETGHWGESDALAPPAGARQDTGGRRCSMWLYKYHVCTHPLDSTVQCLYIQPRCLACATSLLQDISIISSIYSVCLIREKKKYKERLWTVGRLSKDFVISFIFYHFCATHPLLIMGTGTSPLLYSTF